MESLLISTKCQRQLGPYPLTTFLCIRGCFFLYQASRAAFQDPWFTWDWQTCFTYACSSTSPSSWHLAISVVVSERAGIRQGTVMEVACRRLEKRGAGTLPHLSDASGFDAHAWGQMAQLLWGQEGAISNSLPASPPKLPLCLWQSESTIPTFPPSPGTRWLLADLPALSATWQPWDAECPQGGTWGWGELETPLLFIWLPFCGFQKVPAGLQENLIRDGPRPIPVSS